MGCTGFGWARVNLLHASWNEAIFLTYAESNVDDAGMFLLLLSSTSAESRPFLPLTPPHQRAAWGCTRSWEGDTARMADPK